MIKTLTIIAILPLVLTTIFGSIFKFNTALGSSALNASILNITLHTAGKNDKPDPWSQIGTILATVFGIGGLFWGIYTYRGAGTLKRQQILFPLIKEFDKSNEMNIAKELLDDYYPRLRKGWELEKYYYHKENLEYILSIHGVRDPGEVAIRKSFDALLDFFCKLEYLLDLNLITREEIDYFAYYINKAADEPSVIKYIIDYEFPLRGKLHYNLFKPY